MHDTAEPWAEEFDPKSLVILNSAIGEFNVSDKLGQIRTKFFYVLCETDEFYPASIGEGVAEEMRTAGAQVTFHQVSSHMGHYSTSVEPEKWVPQARAFLADL